MFQVQILMGAAALSTLILTGCQTADTGSAANPQMNSAETAVENEGSADTNTLVMKVYGMSCPLCATNVDKQILKVEGVHAVQVDLGTGDVVMQVSKDSPPDEQALIDAVEESGFTLAEKPHTPRPPGSGK